MLCGTVSAISEQFLRQPRDKSWFMAMLDSAEEATAKHHAEVARATMEARELAEATTEEI